MEVAYQTTPEDFIAYCRHSFRRSRTILYSWLMGWIFLPLGIALFALWLFLVGWDEVLPILLLGGSACYLILYPLTYRLWMDLYLRSYVGEKGLKGIVGNIRLVLTKDSLIEITEITRSEVLWKNVHRIDDQGDNMYIYVTPMLAAIVPKHGFRFEEEYDQVKAYVKDCYDRNRPFDPR